MLNFKAHLRWGSLHRRRQTWIDMRDDMRNEPMWGSDWLQTPSQGVQESFLKKIMTAGRALLMSGIRNHEIFLKRNEERMGGECRMSGWMIATVQWYTETKLCPPAPASLRTHKDYCRGYLNCFWHRQDKELLQSQKYKSQDSSGTDTLFSLGSVTYYIIEAT